MVETNLFDVIVISIVILSALLSFFRGFVREILSLGAWVGASLITLYTFMDVAALINPQVNNPTISSGLAALGVFIFSIMVISIFNALLMQLFKKGKDVGLLDNALGLAFGVMRACLLVSLGYFILSFFMPEEDYPAWLADAHTRPYVESGASVIARIAPNYLDSLSPLKNESGTTNPLKIFQNDDALEPAAGDGQGTNWMNVEELERMIESRSDKNNQQ